MIYDRIWEKYDRLRFPYLTVFRRIRPRTYTIVIRSHVLWRNTVVYGAYMAYTVVYDTVYRVRNRRAGYIYNIVLRIGFHTLLLLYKNCVHRFVLILK